VTALLAANDGGHLMQLFTLAPRLPMAEDRIWLTVPTPQTESLLEGERVHWMSPAPTRDYAALARNAWRARSVFGKHRVSAVVSTGASLALSVIPQARARGIHCYYVESATRVDGPSFSGKVLQRVPGVRLYTQHQQWEDGDWSYRGSVLDGYEGVAPERASDDYGIRRVVVSLGTSETYGFRRLLDRLVDLVPPGAELLWQTGSTDVSGLGIQARPKVPAAELFEAMHEADVVIAHAGTGSALAALQAGKLPVLVPRRPEFGEHVDDHQLQIARMLADRDLALVTEVEDLTAGHLRAAAATRVRRRRDLPVMDLD
jgi:UDP-N-acetylglucosamine--N-acetylmuramyl-(pentapeptide) pyrophosphoryl-undecaprenol N-acetylglucosamine transferase